MPSRVEKVQTEERKRRQDIFRKRTKSLFHKGEELIDLTDCWFFLLVRDRSGHTKSLRGSPRHDWPGNVDITNVINDTSGAHKFIRKREMGGLWKAVGVDESRSAVEGDDVDALVEVVVPPKADSGPGTTITVDLGHSDNGEVAAPEGRLSEPLTNQGWQAVNAPDEPDSIVAEMLLDYTTGEVSSESSPPMLEAHSGAVGSGEGEGAAGNQEAAGVQAAAVGEGNRPDLDEPLGARSPVVQHSRQAVEASGGNKAAHRTSEAGPAASGYDAMDLDKPGSQVEAHLLEGASTGVQPHQSHAGWTSEGTGWPEITQTHLQDSMVKRLLLDWEWIWQK